MLRKLSYSPAVPQSPLLRVNFQLGNDVSLTPECRSNFFCIRRVQQKWRTVVELKSNDLGSLNPSDRPRSDFRAL